MFSTPTFDLMSRSLEAREASPWIHWCFWWNSSKGSRKLRELNTLYIYIIYKVIFNVYILLSQKLRRFWSMTNLNLQKGLNLNWWHKAWSRWQVGKILTYVYLKSSYTLRHYRTWGKWVLRWRLKKKFLIKNEDEKKRS